MASYAIRPIKEEEVAEAHRLEIASFPEDEAASYETFVYRQRHAPQLFLVYVESDKICGVVNGLRHTGYNDKCMSEHLPEGPCVCLHTICVDKSKIRQGIASKLLQKFADVAKQEKGAVDILLVAHTQYVLVYQKAGFVERGPASIVHGKGNWTEMGMKIT